MPTDFSHIPIDADTFQDKLTSGFGRVILFLQETDAAPFREAILDACLHHRAFDQQAEGYRTDYLFDILQATGEPEFYAAHIRAALAADNEGDDHGQLYKLAQRLAEGGDEGARRVMYDRFIRCAALQDTTGAEEIVALDGVEGYLFVAIQWQRYPLPEEDHWEEAWLRGQLEEKIGSEAARQALEHASHGHPGLADYFAEVEQKRVRWKAQRGKRTGPPVPPYEEIAARIADPTQTTRWQAWHSWSRRLDAETLALLAADLLTATDRGPLLKLLHLFRMRAFPLSIDRLLQLAQGRDEDLADAAQQALGNLADPRIRTLALELWETTEEPLAVTHMLQHNFLPGDYVRVERLVNQDFPADEYHSLGILTRRLIEANPSPEAVPTLLALYERGHCAICRCSAVELLLTFGPLPPWILDEGRYDADTETRSLAAKAVIADAAG